MTSTALSRPEANHQNVILELISYNREKYGHYTHKDAVEDLLSNIRTDCVNWINLDGLTNTVLIEKLQSHFCLHSLVIEDVLNDQRPKSEEYDDYLFFTLKMLYRIDGDEIDYEQVSFVLGANYLISFQEKEGDMFDTFRERIRLDQGRVRKKGADYLLYRLVDIIVDNYYVVLDRIGERIEELEDVIYANPQRNYFHKIQDIKKEVIYLRKAVYPLREALSRLIKDESGFIEEDTVKYYRDVYDHVVHLTDSLDTYKDLTSSLTDMHMNSLNTRLNEVMKVLAVISTIFIPLTFIVGVYGMNFEFMPELNWKLGYPFVWVVMILMVGAMIGYFKHKKWF